MQNTILTEKDLESIFYDRKRKRKKSPFFIVPVYILVFVLISSLLYVVINFQSLTTNLTYWYKNEYKTSQPETTEIILPKEITPSTQANLPQIANNSIYLPAINIKAPISWNIINNPDDVKNKLELGVIHIDGTAHPGETGNVFITGHSSNYPWAKGNYNNVFALLNKLVAGDVIEVRYNDINYVYKVSTIKVVKPDDISVLKPTKDPVLTLMTCTPVGTSINRLIIISKQIYPDPSSNIKSDVNGGGNVLPKVR